MVIFVAFIKSAVVWRSERSPKIFRLKGESSGQKVLRRSLNWIQSCRTCSAVIGLSPHEQISEGQRLSLFRWEWSLLWPVLSLEIMTAEVIVGIFSIVVFVGIQPAFLRLPFNEWFSLLECCFSINLFKAGSFFCKFISYFISRDATMGWYPLEHNFCFTFQPCNHLSQRI